MKNERAKKRSDPHNKPAPTANLVVLSSAASLPSAPANAASADASALQPALQPAGSPDASELAAARNLIPSVLRDRKFRAKSFAASLSPDQIATLTSWLLSDLTIDDIRKKIAAPPPAGFGKNVCDTTLDRLRAMTKNIDVCAWLNDAMETAQDLLDTEAAGHLAPLRESLALMLYSRAIYAAEQQADSIELQRLVNVLAKLEKLRTSGSRQTSSRSPATRHIVELTVSQAHPPNVVRIASDAALADTAAPPALHEV